MGELRRIAVALGELAAALSRDGAHLILTPVLRAVVEDFVQEPWAHRGITLDVFKLLSQWFLQKHEGLIELNVSSVTAYVPHPVPEGSENGPLTEFWSDEMGRLMVAHNACAPTRRFCIGVACEKAFAGEAIGKYAEIVEPVFPLVGPGNFPSVLEDAYDWETHPDVQRKRISIEMAKAHCLALGATGVVKQNGGSHYKFKFPGASRSWTLSRNDDPIPARYLAELVPITGFPLSVVRHVLVTGSLPRKRLMLSRYVYRAGY